MMENQDGKRIISGETVTSPQQQPKVSQEPCCANCSMFQPQNDNRCIRFPPTMIPVQVGSPIERPAGPSTLAIKCFPVYVKIANPLVEVCGEHPFFVAVRLKTQQNISKQMEATALKEKNKIEGDNNGG